MKLLVLLRFIDLCQWHVNLVLCLSSICDWDAEDHKQDGESTIKKTHEPLGSSTLENHERHIIFNYGFILTCRQTAHAPLTNHKNMCIIFMGSIRLSHFLVYLKRDFVLYFILNTFNLLH